MRTRMFFWSAGRNKFIYHGPDSVMPINRVWDLCDRKAGSTTEWRLVVVMVVSFCLSDWCANAVLSLSSETRLDCPDVHWSCMQMKGNHDTTLVAGPW